MQVTTTSFATSSQAAAAHPAKDTLSRQAVEAIDAYLRRPTPAAHNSPMPATSFLDKLLTFMR